jgi:hypothetical protein
VPIRLPKPRWPSELQVHERNRQSCWAAPPKSARRPVEFWPLGSTQRYRESRLRTNDSCHRSGETAAGVTNVTRQITSRRSDGCRHRARPRGRETPPMSECRLYRLPTAGPVLAQ